MSLSVKEKFVSCSNPKFVESFLRENLEIEVDMSYNDLLCFSCYEYFNGILKSRIFDEYSQLLTGDIVVLSIYQPKIAITELILFFLQFTCSWKYSPE